MSNERTDKNADIERPSLIDEFMSDMRGVISSASAALEADPALRRSAYLFAALLALIVVASWDSFADMARIWSTSSAYGHGYLIAPIALWLVVRRIRTVNNIAVEPTFIGAGALIGGLAVMLVARLAGVSLIEQAAAVGLIPAAVLAAMGWRVLLAFWFPLLFLFFMAPAGQFLIPPLQDFTAEFIVAWLRGIGIPVYIDGIFIQIPTGAFKVAEACAGLNFLIASLVIGALFAYLSFRNWRYAAIFMGLSIAIPIIANGFRALGIVLVAYWSNHTIAVGVDHLVYGWVFLSFVTLLILAAGVWLRGREPESAMAAAPAGAAHAFHAQEAADAGTPSKGFDRKTTSANKSTGKLAAIGAAAVAVLMLTPVIDWRMSAPPDDMTAALSPPSVEGWISAPASEDQYDAQYEAADLSAHYTYRRADEQTVDLFISYYHYERGQAEAVNSLNNPYDYDPEGEGDPIWDRAASDLIALQNGGARIQANALDLVGPRGRRRFTTQFYWAGGALTGARGEAKINTLLARLSGGERAAAVIVVSAPYTEDYAAARALVAEFVEDAPGLSAYFSER